MTKETTLNGELKFYAILGALIFAFVLAINLVMVGDKKAQAVKVLHQQGVSITKIEYAFFGCGRDDSFNFKFEGVNDRGEAVDGNVCSAILKGATVRFN